MARRGAAGEPPAVFLMGPTATGKTDLALSLCRQYPFEIISVDSALVYRGLEIGAARPSDAELEEAPHRLINYIDPAETCSAVRFREDALEAMAEIRAAGRVPLLVGGTMLYFKVLREGLPALPPANPELRRELAARAEQEGWPALHAELAAVDPAIAARLHPNHSQRIQRALEVYYCSGRPLSAWQSDPPVAPLPYRVLQLALVPPDRSVLHERIARRFHAMLAEGLVDEVRALFRRGDLHAGLPAIRAVGYRQVWQYLAGEIDEQTMIQSALAATRQLAKRQFTWLRDWPDLQRIEGLESAALDEAEKYLSLFTL